MSAPSTRTRAVMRAGLRVGARSSDRQRIVVSPRGDWGLTVVTGASSGLGGELAAALAAEKVPLVVTGRDEVALRRLAAGRGATVATVPADLGYGSTVEGAAAVAAAAIERGGARTLISSAGIGFAGPAEDTPVPAIEALVGLNVLAPLVLTRMLLPGMLAAGEGRIVLIGSIASLGVAGEAVYSATKAALVGFADALRSEVAGRGVTVTLVLPGPVDTAFYARRGVPYGRRRPALLPAAGCAAAILDAARAGRPELYLPGWLSLAARVRGAAPGLYRALAARWG